MGARGLVAGCAVLVAITLGWAASARAQDETTAPPPAIALDPSPVDFSLAAYIGRPDGYIRVGENGNKGNKLRLHDDLNIMASEAADASLAFHFNPKNAVRASILYYFLRGRGLLDRPIVYNGEVFTNPGHVTSDLDFYRVSLAYERRYVVPGGVLTSSLGLTYVHFDPEISAHGHGNSEDFFRQELPVPIIGLRFDIPMGNGFGATAAVSGGGLPRIDSGRREGGTVYLRQVHGDAGFGLTYAFTKALGMEIGPRLTYFYQRETSHEDDNRFQLFDYGVRAGLTLKF